MPSYWGTRMRRGVWTKNWHWYAANAARLANFFTGNGLTARGASTENPGGAAA